MSRVIWTIFTMWISHKISSLSWPNLNSADLHISSSDTIRRDIATCDVPPICSQLAVVPLQTGSGDRKYCRKQTSVSSSKIPISLYDPVGDEWLHFLLPSVKVASCPLIAPLTTDGERIRRNLLATCQGSKEIAFYMSTERRMRKAGNIEACRQIGFE